MNIEDFYNSQFSVTRQAVGSYKNTPSVLSSGNVGNFQTVEADSKRYSQSDFTQQTILTCSQDIDIKVGDIITHTLQGLRVLSDDNVYTVKGVQLADDMLDDGEDDHQSVTLEKKS